MSKKWVESPKEPFQILRQKDGVIVPVVTLAGNEIWCCGECGVLSPSWTKDPVDAKQKAVDCCKQPYCECGTKLDGYWLKCEGCRAKDQSKKWENAVEIEDYDGALYDNDKDRYYFDMDEFLDQMACLEDDEEELPTWVFPCKERGFGKIDASDILENQLSDHFEDAYDHVIDDEGLQKFLNEWCAKQTLKSYEADYTRKINVAKLCEKEKQSQKQ